MKWIDATGFLIYLAMLAFFDLKTHLLPAALIVTGGATGLLLRLAAVFSGEMSPAILLWRYGSGLIWGILLLLLVRPSRRGIGKGDGLSFLSFAFWQENTFVFSLLLLSLLLLASFGLLLTPKGESRIRRRLPLMPFVFAAALGLTLAGLLEGASP